MKGIVESLDIRALLNAELRKGQPDNFLVTQIGRTLKLHNPKVSLELCGTLLAPTNLHAFRASWSTIMRGVTSVRSLELFADIFEGLDRLLDDIPDHSPHLLQAEASCLHYLRTVRFRRTERRAKYVLQVYESASSETVKRACIDCWRLWKDRTSFIRERNRWGSLGVEAQRMLWLAAANFGDDGEKFRLQVRHSLPNAWALDIERKNKSTFASIYTNWATDDH